MSFSIVTDTSANLPTDFLRRNNVPVIGFSYLVDGVEKTCLDTGKFDDKEYYGRIRRGLHVITSQITPHKYIDVFEPILQKGEDILFIGMSSGISGSLSSARVAAAELGERYPARTLRIIDTRGASLGEGLHVINALKYKESGLSLDETGDCLERDCRRMCQIFTVDDLMHLRRNGRLSNAAAIVGTMLGIKPMLKGDNDGKIVACGKVRGRRAIIQELASRYARLVRDPEKQTVGIAQADCPDDAAYLATLLKKLKAPRKILTVKYEPVTGSHVGPGALALFFFGGDMVRNEV